MSFGTRILSNLIAITGKQLPTQSMLTIIVRAGALNAEITREGERIIPLDTGSKSRIVGSAVAQDSTDNCKLHGLLTTAPTTPI